MPRENQGLQIALILFVMLTVALAVTTYLYFRKAEENFVARQAAEESRTSEKQLREATQLDNQRLKQMLGYDIAESMENVEANFKADMQILPPDVPEEERNYRQMPNHLFTFVVKNHEQMVTQLDTAKKLIAEKQQAESDRDTQVAQNKDMMTKAQQDLLAERQKFETDRGEHQNIVAKFRKQAEDKTKEVTALASRSGKTIEGLQRNMDRLNQLLEGTQAQLADLTVENFENPDGKITWVNQGSNLVWVNLGSEDGIPRQATFSVYDQGEQAYSEETVKGSIEITKILDGHLSEGRIVHDELANPILPGDVVYTPTWQPGGRIHFAMVGLMDVDGDDRDDHQLVRNLITMNGGVIDAEDVEGRMKGEMTVNTRYIVLGERPTEASKAEAIQVYSQMFDKAQELGIEQMPLKKLLSQMGYRGGTKTVTLGRGTELRAPAPAANGDAAPADNGEFRERRPPARGDQGAF